MYKHKSGALKRRGKLEKDNKETKGCFIAQFYYGSTLEATEIFSTEVRNMMCILLVILFNLNI